LSQQWQQPAGQPGGGWQQPAGQPSGGWQQGQPHQAGQQGHAQQAGGLHLRTKFFPLAFILYLLSPRCSIDGSGDIALRWGDNHLPVPAGRHHVRVWFPYMFMKQCGKAETVVEVGQSGLALEYKAPTWFVFSPGKLSIPGHGPAPAAGPGGAAAAVQGAYQQHPQHQAQAGSPVGTPGAWHADPTGRFEQRYWDGQAWTAHVVRDGVQATDPI
jgi:hypothetical protein